MKNTAILKNNWKVLVMAFGLTMACFGPLMASEGGRTKGAGKAVKTDAIELVAKGAEKPVSAEQQNVRLAQRTVVLDQAWVSVTETGSGDDQFVIGEETDAPDEGSGPGCRLDNEEEKCTVLIHYDPLVVSLSTLNTMSYAAANSTYGVTYSLIARYQ